MDLLEVTTNDAGQSLRQAHQLTLFDHQDLWIISLTVEGAPLDRLRAAMGELCKTYEVACTTPLTTQTQWTDAIAAVHGKYAETHISKYVASPHAFFQPGPPDDTAETP